MKKKKTTQGDASESSKRPKQDTPTKRIVFHTNIAAVTHQRLTQLKLKWGLSYGEVVDRLVQES